MFNHNMQSHATPYQLDPLRANLLALVDAAEFYFLLGNGVVNVLQKSLKKMKSNLEEGRTYIK